MGVFALDAYVLIVKGSDRYKFLDGLSTNKVDGTCSTVFTTKNAKIIDMADIIEMPEILAIIGHRPYKNKLIEHISSRILGQDVTISDVSDANNVYISTNDIEVNDGVTKVETFRGFLIVAPTRIDITVDMTLEEFSEYRIQNLIPHQGYEITEKVNPLVCGLGHLVHEAKGCYIGQEILVRMRSRGRINKKLVCVKNPTSNATTVGRIHSLKIDRA